LARSIDISHAFEAAPSLHSCTTTEAPMEENGPIRKLPVRLALQAVLSAAAGIYI
jgi:hypothetical protein